MKNLSKMKKDELIALAEKHNFSIEPGATKIPISTHGSKQGGHEPKS